MYNKPEFEILDLCDVDILTSSPGGLHNNGEGNLDDIPDYDWD